MKKPAAFVVFAASFLLLAATPARARFTFTLQENGSGVTITGAGSLNTTGLVSDGGTTNIAARIITTNSYLAAGVYSGLVGFTITGPANRFGTGTAMSATTSTGDGIGLAGNQNRLLLLPGYVSGSALSNVSTYSGATFTSLGFTPGTYTYSLPSGDALVVTSNAVPEPSTWACVAAGAGLLGFATLRRRARLAA